MFVGGKEFTRVPLNFHQWMLRNTKIYFRGGAGSDRVARRFMCFWGGSREVATRVKAAGAWAATSATRIHYERVGDEERIREMEVVERTAGCSLGESASWSLLNFFFFTTSLLLLPTRLFCFWLVAGENGRVIESSRRPRCTRPRKPEMRRKGILTRAENFFLF